MQSSNGTRWPNPSIERTWQGPLAPFAPPLMSNVRSLVRAQNVHVTLISVKVKTSSRVSLLSQVEGAWLAQLKSPPVDGKANEELFALVARHFGCPKSAVSLKSGASARTKLIRIESPSPARAKPFVGNAS